MAFNVSSTKLFSQLQAASRLVAERNSLQILESILFDIEGDMLILEAADVTIARNYLTNSEVSEIEETKTNYKNTRTTMEMEEMKVNEQLVATQSGEIPQWFYEHKICLLEKHVAEIDGKMALMGYRIDQLEKSPKSMTIDTLHIKDLQYPSSKLTSETPLPAIEDENSTSDECDLIPLCKYFVVDSIKTDTQYGYGWGETPNEVRKIEQKRIENFNREFLNLIKKKKYNPLAKKCLTEEAKGHLDFMGHSKYAVGRSFQELCPDVVFDIDSFSAACRKIGWQPKQLNVKKK